jgi:hypothetical protein
MPWDCGPHDRHPLCFARSAPFGFVSELLIVEKRLFSGSEDEVRAAVKALQHLVLVFH